MDLNGPGTSLFQGNDLHNFDSLAQREEEEEDLEEQKRREIELKNMLENAFDDVSFDNDEGSICNVSQNHSSSGHSTYMQNHHDEIIPNVFKQIPQIKVVPEFDKNYINNHIDTFNTSIKQFPTNNQINRLDFNNDGNNSDQSQKKLQNGSLHDIVDASGGGEDNPQVSVHFNHCFQRNSLGEKVCNRLPVNNTDKIIELATENAYDSNEQLKIFYDIRVREVHRLTELIDSMRNKHEIEVKDLKHQLALLLAEKERSSISQTQLQNLLVASKEEVESLTNNLKILEQTNKELELSKNELLMELEAVKLTTDELQKKVLILERGNKSQSEALQYELNLKALTEKHNMELMGLKSELDIYLKKYDTVMKENEELKLKISNLSLINEENLTKKSEIINRLSKQIEETQKQCENLMKSSTNEEFLKLQMEVKMLKEEKSLLSLRLEVLEKENSRQEEELQQFESLSKISFFNENISDSKELDGSNMNGKLQAELHRALHGLKAKRLEIKNMQAQLDENNEKISFMTENEQILKNKVNEYKDEAQAHLLEIKNFENIICFKENEISEMQQTIEKLKSQPSDLENNLRLKNVELEKEIEILRNQINSLEKEKTEIQTNYSEEYMRFHNEGLEKVRGETEKHFKLEIFKKDMEIEKLKKEIEEIKNLYVEVFNSKENLIAQLIKEKDNSERNSGVDMEGVKKMQKEVEKSRHRILELEQTLKEQYQQEVEILNLEINQLNLETEKIKKEKDREVGEKDKVLLENELLKSEIKQVLSEKNLLFLSHEKIQKEVEELRINIQKIKSVSEDELNKLVKKHELELENLTNKYDNTIKQLKKELDLGLVKPVKYDSRYTSPEKSTFVEKKNVSTQGCCLSADKATSPIRVSCVLESNLSLLSDEKKKEKSPKESLSLRDISIITDPEPVKIPKKQVIELMTKLGAHHEEEMRVVQNQYQSELVKLNQKFQIDFDKAKEIIRKELQKEHILEIEQLEEKHRIELENRIEEEKKEAVVDLITEWACEVQSLKVSYAEAQAEMERMKMKYKAAKSIALQYKTYFKNKAEHMKEEWKRIEDGYERALKDLEKNVHILVDVKEDEVKAKVESITKIYEEKINKMKEKLSKCESRLKAEKRCNRKEDKTEFYDRFDIKKRAEKLSIPESSIGGNSDSSKKKNKSELSYQLREYKILETDGAACSNLKKGVEETKTLLAQKIKCSGEKLRSKEELSDKERTSR